LARKNEAEHTEVKTVEHVVPSRPVLAEQAIYMEPWLSKSLYLKMGRPKIASISDVSENAIRGVVSVAEISRSQAATLLKVNTPSSE
jgi:hypothetical protein